MAKLLFFGRFSDISGPRDMPLPDGVNDSDVLIAWLSDGDAALAAQFARAGNRVAVNKVMIQEAVPITDSDEIAFMSALSGG